MTEHVIGDVFAERIPDVLGYRPDRQMNRAFCSCGVEMGIWTTPGNYPAAIVKDQMLYQHLKGTPNQGAA